MPQMCNNILINAILLRVNPNHNLIIQLRQMRQRSLRIGSSSAGVFFQHLPYENNSSIIPDLLACRISFTPYSSSNSITMFSVILAHSSFVTVS
ncbi:hypothetical protein HAV15_011090 [Penicillium sp. str. |nr:hypothetical protein HAV15_011090 [Penicillium sp. str. \